MYRHLLIVACTGCILVGVFLLLSCCITAVYPASLFINIRFWIHQYIKQFLSLTVQLFYLEYCDLSRDRKKTEVTVSLMKTSQLGSLTTDRRWGKILIDTQLFFKTIEEAFFFVYKTELKREIIRVR